MSLTTSLTAFDMPSNWHFKSLYACWPILKGSVLLFNTNWCFRADAAAFYSYLLLAYTCMYLYLTFIRFVYPSPTVLKYWPFCQCVCFVNSLRSTRKIHDLVLIFDILFSLLVLRRCQLLFVRKIIIYVYFFFLLVISLFSLQTFTAMLYIHVSPCFEYITVLILFQIN